MINRLLFLLPFIFSFSLTAQNLVLNPSFEDTITHFCGISVNSSFDQVINTWTNPTGGSPDMYFSTINQFCFNHQPFSSYTGPIGLKGSQSPRTGEVFAGIFIHTIQGLNQREYIQVPLTSPLIPGGTYIVEYYVSLADNHEFASSNIQGLLSLGGISGSSDAVHIANAQIIPNAIIAETNEWVKVCDTVVADMNYAYLTIGNFEQDDNTNLEANPSATFAPGTYGSYYFIDDVSVSRYLTSVKDKNIQVSMFPNPVKNVLNVEVNGQFQIKILDCTGKNVYRQCGLNYQTSIRTQSFTPGVYFLYVVTPEGLSIQRFVK